MAMDGDQELLLALRTKGGATWGCLGLYRAPGEEHFDADQKRFLQSVAPAIGEGVRRALLIGEARDPDTPHAPGLLVLTEQLEIESATPGTERWLADLPGGDGGQLPPAVMAVGGQALRTADGDRPGEVAMARVLSDSGNWVVLHGATLVATGTRRVAVIVEPGHPARIQPLLMAAYGLTAREQEVARLVLQGESTNGIAERLVVSPHTVQEHLKSIFEKTGVRSRRDLVGKVFFNHYEPRLRDNEQRVLDGRPLRGGPAEGPRSEVGLVLGHPRTVEPVAPVAGSAPRLAGRWRAAPSACGRRPGRWRGSAGGRALRTPGVRCGSRPRSSNRPPCPARVEDVTIGDGLDVLDVPISRWAEFLQAPDGRRW